MSPEALQELLRRPTISVKAAAEILGLSLNSTYSAARNGDIETIRVQKKILVLTAPLRKKLGL